VKQFRFSVICPCYLGLNFSKRLAEKNILKITYSLLLKTYASQATQAVGWPDPRFYSRQLGVGKFLPLSGKKTGSFHEKCHPGKMVFDSKN